MQNECWVAATPQSVFITIGALVFKKLYGMTTAESNKRREELLKLILKKSNMTYSEFLLMVKQNFVFSNLDMLTETEKKKFNIKR